MKIAIGSDHGGFELKAEVIRLLEELAYQVTDCGCYSSESVDYPDFADSVCNAVGQGDCNKGILICGTGIGMSIAANRNRSIRAALCHDGYTARLCREHNDANVLCMGARVIGAGVALDIVRIFLETAFEGGRHQRRIAKFSD